VKDVEDEGEVVKEDIGGEAMEAEDGVGTAVTGGAEAGFGGWWGDGGGEEGGCGGASVEGG
jgi:hypothetical protein